MVVVYKINCGLMRSHVGWPLQPRLWPDEVTNGLAASTHQALLVSTIVNVIFNSFSLVL